MAIEWTPELSTGVTEIDNQHKELFNRVNALLDACKSGKGKAEVAGVMKFVEGYVVGHFNAEEAQMRLHGYPGLPDHKGRHAGFIRDFGGLKALFEKEGATVHMVVRTNQLLVDWLIEHIRKTDKELGDFLKTKPAP